MVLKPPISQRRQRVHFWCYDGLSTVELTTNRHADCHKVAAGRCPLRARVILKLIQRHTSSGVPRPARARPKWMVVAAGMQLALQTCQVCSSIAQQKADATRCI